MKTTPLSRVGAYVPGGRAAYPSTALMCTIPARIAGVPEICCCSPPPIQPLTLVALDIAGVKEIYQCGGAQAIAAMALGTETIAPVDKIVGPGNVYVTAAKMMLREFVEIDFPAGPSEIAVIADESAVPAYVAADILAQAEHDPHAACLLITTSAALADRVGAEIKKQAEHAPRKEIMAQALKNSGTSSRAILTERLRSRTLSHPSTSPFRLPIPSRSLAAYRTQVRSLSGRTRRSPAGIMPRAPTTCSRRQGTPGNILASMCTTSVRPLRFRFSQKTALKVSVRSSKPLPPPKGLLPTHDP